jgi:hypothetical protein
LHLRHARVLLFFRLCLVDTAVRRQTFMCNRAAERSEAKSEWEFREAKVKYIQLHLFV